MDLTEFDLLPSDVGERHAYEHGGVRYFLTATGDDQWLVGRDGSGQLLGVLRRVAPFSFTLDGPTGESSGESWMLLLAGL